MKHIKIRKSLRCSKGFYYLFIDEGLLTFIYAFNLEDYFLLGTNNEELNDRPHLGELIESYDLSPEVYEQVQRIISETEGDRLTALLAIYLNVG